MSAFRPARLGPADVTALVTDPDLAAASGALQAAFTAAVAPKASQASVDALGATLTPVINTRASQASVDNLGATLGPAIVNATADKATSAELAVIRALVTPKAGDIKTVTRLGGVADEGWVKASGSTLAVNQFTKPNHLLLPYTENGSGILYASITICTRATVGDALIVKTGAASLRQFTPGLGTWATLPVVPFGVSYPASVFGTCAGGLLATGFLSGATTAANALYTYSYTTQAWAARVNLPTARHSMGIADIGGGCSVLFGGASSGTLPAASLNEVLKFNNATNAFTTLTPLPFRMYGINTAVLSTGAVVLFPLTMTADGVTLATNAPRRCFSWTESGGTVELDAMTENWSAPTALFPQSDGTLVYVPATAPTGLRARRLNPAAAAGSQWTQIDFAIPEGFSASALTTGQESKRTAGGFTHYCAGPSTSYSLIAAQVSTPATDWAETFNQVKT